MNFIFIFYNLSTTILQLIQQTFFFIISFDLNGSYLNPLQLIYNYFITSSMNIYFNYFIHPFEQ